MGTADGLNWTTLIGWQEIFVALFILAMSYAVSFHLLKTKVPWLVAAGTCVIVALAICIKPILENGFYALQIGITAIEWFVAGSIAGILAMLVRDRPANEPKRKTNYY